jgi:hypothetical protein
VSQLPYQGREQENGAPDAYNQVGGIATAAYFGRCARFGLVERVRSASVAGNFPFAPSRHISATARLGRGDIVSCQLSNVTEFVLLHHAALKRRTIFNPTHLA